MGPGGLPGLQNRVSGGIPLTGGFDSHAPSPRNATWQGDPRELLSFPRYFDRLAVLTTSLTANANLDARHADRLRRPIAIASARTNAWQRDEFKTLLPRSERIFNSSSTLYAVFEVDTLGAGDMPRWPGVRWPR